MLRRVPVPRRHRYAVNDLLDLLGRRWMLRVLWELRAAPLTYGQLRAACDELSTSVLADRLRELGEAGLVARDEAGAYVLTPYGAELRDHLLPLSAFAERWREGAR